MPQVRIFSGDKDLWQLVASRAGVPCLYPESSGHGRSRAQVGNYTRVTEVVMERLGVAPGQVSDLKALAGDASDEVKGVPGIGVKGVPGIGEKTVTRLLQVRHRGQPALRCCCCCCCFCCR